MSSSEEWQRKSIDAKASADRCQIHTDGYRANMTAAQLYATWAIFWELRNARLDSE